MDNSGRPSEKVIALTGPIWIATSTYLHTFRQLASGQEAISTGPTKYVEPTSSAYLPRPASY